MSQMTKLAFVLAKAGQADELGRRLRALALPSRLEAGCLSFDVQRSSRDPDLWLVYESWSSPAALAAHAARAPVRDFVKDAPRLIAASTPFEVSMST
jgi:quinol monooxygenase YgiN